MATNSAGNSVGVAQVRPCRPKPCPACLPNVGLFVVLSGSCFAFSEFSRTCPQTCCQLRTGEEREWGFKLSAPLHHSLYSDLRPALTELMEISRDRRRRTLFPSPPLTATLPTARHGQATAGTGRSFHERCRWRRRSPCETSADSFPTTGTAVDNSKHAVDSSNEHRDERSEQQLFGLAMAGLVGD